MPLLTKTKLAALATVSFLAFGVVGSAQAKPVDIAIAMKNYSGNGAYLAAYLTDANGKYLSTLHVAGGKQKYWRHLKGWSRASGGKIEPKRV